jgi:IS30 family transposase
MLHYNHLTLKEREAIYMMNLYGQSKGSIARKLNRCRSTITRELKRNACEGGSYTPIRAHEHACVTRLSGYCCKLDKDENLNSYVCERLKDGWSPQTISGRLRHEQADSYVSPETIYQFIYSKKERRRGLHKYLIRKHKKRKVKCGRKPNRRTIKDLVPISQRSEQINQRTNIGDFEMDLVFFKGNMSTNIVTMVDRKSRLILLSKALSKHALDVNKAIVNKIDQLPPKARKSATFDRGTEFANHTLLRSAYGMQTFFCNPHSPWQKGQVENANGRLRRFLADTTCIKKLSTECLQNVQNRMNNQPRRCLGYRTPHEVFFDELNKINGGCCCG